ncbi:MAG: bifunctional oligoribonuclease/PAP phosphatase NrnA [Patescibacteria group bacterium]
MNDKYNQAFEKIQKANNILIVTHERPDGDALASACLMIELLIKLEKKFAAYCSDQPVPNYLFLPRIEKIISNKELLNFDNFDLIIVLDCGSLERTCLKDEIKGRKENQFIIELDHHPKVYDYANLEIRLPEAVATAEILYNFLKANKININKNMANCILTGLLTDTSNFLHQSTSDNAINIASEMLIRGAQFQQIVKNTVRNKSLSAMKVSGKVLDNLKINKKYNLAFSVITKEDLKDINIEEDVFEGITNFLGNLYGVKGVMLLREEAGRLKGSLRSSHPNADVSKLASIFGGGGHAKSSGFMVDGRLERDGERWKVV